MNDTELIKAALQIQKDENDELIKLLEEAGFDFVPLLLFYILGLEDTIDDILQDDLDEVVEIAEKIMKNHPNKAPGIRKINRALKDRSFVTNMTDKAVPDMRASFFGLYEENTKSLPGSSTPDFDYQTKSYKSLEKWLKELPDTMKLTTDSKVSKLIIEAYEEGKGTGWLEQRLSEDYEFSRARARTTAITENLRMYSGSGYEAFLQNEWVIGVRWRHTHGIREPRPHHEAMDGIVVPKAELFTVGAYQGYYPRDPQLPAGETVHCHCFIEPVLSDALTGENNFTNV